MTAGEYCNREVVVAGKSESVREAVKLMRNYHVGDVVVVDKQNEQAIPVGILTDRDVVVEILAKDVDIDSVAIGDVMSYELLTLSEDTKLIDAIKQMRSKGVRRAPVTNQQGAMIGILTVDDILDLLAEQLTDLVSLVLREQGREMKQRQ